MVNQQLATNTFTTAKWIVSATASDGTHTTIAAALTAASSGDTIFIRPGTYTENLTLKAGVNLAAYGGDGFTPTVSIVGKSTFTAAGTVTITGIRLTTNSDFFLAVTGSAISIVYLESCYLNCLNNTGISHTSSAASVIYIQYCKGNTATTGIAYFASSSLGDVKIYFSDLQNTGGSATASTMSAGNFFLINSSLDGPLTFSGTTSGMQIFHSDLFGPLIFNSTAAAGGTILLSYLAAGSSSAISIGAGSAVYVEKCPILSSNTNVITGSGTLIYTDISFKGSSTGINATTINGEYTNLAKYKATQQPMFSAYNTTAPTNVTGDGTLYTVVFDTELYDVGGNFSSNTFTAPETGYYHFDFGVLAQSVIATMGANLALVTTSATYYQSWGVVGGSGNWDLSGSRTVFMTATNTATITIDYNGGAKVVDIYGAGGDPRTYFSGQLIG